jgi:hypothetical protein
MHVVGKAREQEGEERREEGKQTTYDDDHKKIITAVL